MSSFKPIEATPELCGEDAKRVIKEVLEKTKSSSVQRNEKLISILKEIRRQNRVFDKRKTRCIAA